MGQKYAAYDQSGKITGFYDSVDSPVPQGKTVLAITDEQWMNCLKSPGHTVVDNQLVSPTAPSDAERRTNTVRILTRAVQSALDSGAQSWGYDNLIAATSYASSTNQQFAIEAARLIAWRDQVWVWAFSLFDTVDPATTTQQFLANMPAKPDKPTS